MKLAAFPMVTRLATARAGLVHQLERGKLGICIDGAFQDAETVERVKPAIHDALKAWIAEIDEDLRQLGVDLD